MNNLLSGLIGTIVGALIGFFATFFALYLSYSIDFAVDNEAAVIELKSVKSIASSILLDNPNQLPKYQLLNMDVAWKKVLIDIGDEDSEKLYFEINKIDTLRKLIIQSEDKDIQLSYTIEYRRLLNELIESRVIDNEIAKLTKKNANRFGSSSQIDTSLVQG